MPLLLSPTPLINPMTPLPYDQTLPRSTLLAWCRCSAESTRSVPLLHSEVTPCLALPRCSTVLGPTAVFRHTMPL